MDIYRRKSYLKKVLLIIALLIASFTLFYTNGLVKKLEQREQKIIDLYAKGMQAIISSSDNSDISFMFSEIIEANNSIPVILTDENYTPIPGRHRNIDIPENASEEQVGEILRSELEEMRKQHEPIVVAHEDIFKNYVFYKNSFLLTQLKYFPYIQLVIGVSFIAIAYMAFSYSRKSEQNMVWVGMAKETAHQLGTPLSSMMGWMDYFRSSEKFSKEPVITELDKDVRRLQTITERFSNIGSLPELQEVGVKDVIEKFTDYLKSRISKKVAIYVKGENCKVMLNVALFEWGLENLCKNAVDAMKGEGSITIDISGRAGKCSIEIVDTGPGMSSEVKSRVFHPGFTTKKRGWGLGLTLTKRIIEEYHKGKVLVKNSTSEGTAFQITLNQA